jgi:hypothetical protein
MIGTFNLPIANFRYTITNNDILQVTGTFNK